MIRRHYLVEIKRVKELLLSTLSPPHHGPTPANHLSIRRNHGSPVASTRVLQHIRGKADIGQVPRRSWTGCLALKAGVRLGANWLMGSHISRRDDALSCRAREPSRELEHVPSQLNQGDSLRAKDERVYRH